MVFFLACKVFAVSENAQNYRRPLQGKIGRIIPQRENFPCEGSFSLENSFPFPSEWTVFSGNEGFGKKGTFMPQGKIYDFPPRGQIYLKPFFLSQKMLGAFFCRSCLYKKGVKMHSKRLEYHRLFALTLMTLEWTPCHAQPRGVRSPPRR